MDQKIELRNVTMTPEWEARITEGIDRLAAHHPGVIHHFRLVLAAAGHQRLGLFEVKLVASVPQDTIVVNHKGEEVLPLLVKCFEIMDRELKEYGRRRQQIVKHHDERPAGTVAELFPGEDYGLINSFRGDVVYFHRNAVKDMDFAALAVGDLVEFGEEPGDAGPQAVWVRRR